MKLVEFACHHFGNLLVDGGKNSVIGNNKDYDESLDF